MLFTSGFVDAFVRMNITPEQSLTRSPGISAARDALLFTGLVILLLGLIALEAMLGAPDYGKRIGGTTVALGVAGLAAAAAVLVGVPAMGGAVGVFALIGFHLTLVWKAHRLARAPHSRMLAGVDLASPGGRPAVLQDAAAWTDAPRQRSK